MTTETEKIIHEAIKQVYRDMKFPEHQLERLTLNFVKNPDNAITLDIIEKSLSLQNQKLQKIKEELKEPIKVPDGTYSQEFIDGLSFAYDYFGKRIDKIFKENE